MSFVLIDLNQTLNGQGTEAFQAILDDVAQTDSRAKKIKAEDFIDKRFLEEMTKSGFFDKLWGEKS